MTHSGFNLKRSVGQREGCACGGASMHGAQRRGIARYSKELQRRHVPPQACHSRCSVIHPVGDQNHRSYFLQNQKPVIRRERSTDFFRFKIISPLMKRVEWHRVADRG
ncbi:MAG: hypothetical protein P8179_14935 [Candidatus Thiodiazotropha sp.]